jgi:hypothetical protein
LGRLSFIDNITCVITTKKRINFELGNEYFIKSQILKNLKIISLPGNPLALNLILKSQIFNQNGRDPRKARITPRKAHII